jgi:hypothetical protein
VTIFLNLEGIYTGLFKKKLVKLNYRVYGRVPIDPIDPRWGFILPGLSNG